MTNNRELSQIANLIEVLDSSKHINIKSEEGQNIGIGSTIPAYKVEVIGDARVSNKVTTENISVGVATVSTRVIVTNDLDVSGVSTVSTLNVEETLTSNKEVKVLGLTTTTDFQVIGVTTVSSLTVGSGGTIATIDADGSVGIGTSTKIINLNSDVYVSGILTATSINITENISYAANSGVSTLSEGLTGSPSITVSDLNVTTGVSTFAGQIDGNGGADISGGETTLSSLTVSDLSAGRVVFVGAGGSLTDDVNLSFGANGLVVGSNGIKVTGVSTFSGSTSINDSASITYNGSDAALTVTQTGSGNALLIEDSASADSTPFVVNALGQTGIGTTNPGSLLHALGSYGTVRVENDNTAQYAASGIELKGPAGDERSTKIIHGNSNAGGTETYFQIEQYDPAGSYVKTLAQYGYEYDYWAFNTGGTEKLRVTSDGFLGIGTTSPLGIVHAEGGTSYFIGTVGINTTVIKDSTQLDCGNSNVFTSGYLNVGLGVTQANVARVNFVGGVTHTGGTGTLLVTNNTTSTPTTIFSGLDATTLSLFAGGMQSANQRGGQIDFVGGANTASGYAGQLLFRTGISTGGTPQAITGRLDTSGIMYANTFTSTSDERLKANIETIDDSLDILNEVRGVRYNWKDGGDPSVGVIAQEVEKVLPEAVKTDPEGMKSVCYDMLIGVLIEAVKDQQKRIDDLEERLNAKEQL